MKRAYVLTAALALALAAVTPVPGGAAQGDAELNRILARMEAAGKSIKSFQANVNQKKRDKTLGATDRSAGTIYFKGGAPGSERVLLDYTKPVPQTISVVGEKVIIYQPRINQAFFTTRQKQSAKNSNLSFLTVGYNQAGTQLRERYDITLLGPETVAPLGTTVLSLKPKQPTPNSPRRIQVWVDDKTGLPVQYVLLGENEETTVTLSNVQTNLNLPDSKFELNLPGSVKKVEG